MGPMSVIHAYSLWAGLCPEKLVKKMKQSKTKAQGNWSHNNRMFPSSSDSTYDRLSELKAKGEG